MHQAYILHNTFYLYDSFLNYKNNRQPHNNPVEGISVLQGFHTKKASSALNRARPLFPTERSICTLSGSHIGSHYVRFPSGCVTKVHLSSTLTPKTPTSSIQWDSGINRKWPVETIFTWWPSSSDLTFRVGSSIAGIMSYCCFSSCKSWNVGKLTNSYHFTACRLIRQWIVTVWRDIGWYFKVKQHVT